MAFITNRKVGGKKLGDRLSELVEHSKQLDMLVGFFFSLGLGSFMTRSRPGQG